MHPDLPFDPTSLKKALPLGLSQLPQFRTFLKQFPSKTLDPLVGQMAKEESARINCLACGACCRALEPELATQDLNRLARLQNLSLEQFRRLQTQTSRQGSCFLKARPCPFLQGNACGIYAQRPSSCRDFPHLETPHFRFRLQVWEHYRLCPIVFSTVERLKIALKFNFEQS